MGWYQPLSFYFFTISFAILNFHHGAEMRQRNIYPADYTQAFQRRNRENAQELYEDLHLASMGKLTARGGKSGSLGGWQKNDVKALAGIGSGFSGLLEGITSTFSKNTAGLELPKTEKIWTPAPQTRLNTNPMQPEIISQTTNTEPDPIMNSTVCETPETEQNPLHRMILPGFAVGAVFLIFGLVLLALKQITAGAVFCIIALSGAALAAAGLVMDRKSGPDSIIDSGR